MLQQQSGTKNLSSQLSSQLASLRKEQCRLLVERERAGSRVSDLLGSISNDGIEGELWTVALLTEGLDI